MSFNTQGMVFGLAIAASALASPATASDGVHDGAAILRMCQGGEKVKALSMMCHSYLNGYLDTIVWQAQKAGGGKSAFCLGAGDKKGLPGKLVLWLRAHPMESNRPAPELLGKALKDLFPCR
ncbi:MAG TPA: Rap1a/Tai family immunity protein [Thiobacillaceae bacterium]|nr:Rap1a/Tai family immunity protein [Thiobacillaceae bacterium]